MNKVYKTIVIDDEPDAVGFITSIIQEYCPQLQVVGTANSVKEGIEIINQNQPDLVLLDVEMPYGNGFDLLTHFPDKNFDVIFITAFNHYAIKAIKFSAVDYILKPVNISEFIEAIKKITDKRDNKQYISNDFKVLFENLLSATPAKLAIPTNEGIEYLNTNEIVRLEADRSYCWFFLSDNRKILVSRNMKEFQELLSDRMFFRPHNSHLINLKFVKKFVKREGSYIEMNDKTQIPISRNKRDLFLALMTKI